MTGGPKWRELFLILYDTLSSTELKVNTTGAVTVCLFRILTIEQIILNPMWTLYSKFIDVKIFFLYVKRPHVRDER